MRDSALVAEVPGITYRITHRLGSQPVCQVPAAAYLLQPGVCEGWGFVSKHQGGPDSEDGTLSLGCGFRWAEGLCWYIQGDLKM